MAAISQADPSTVRSHDDILKMIKTLSMSDLTYLVSQAQTEESARKQKVQALYGQWFSSLVGFEQLCNLPEVSAEALSLNVDYKYPEMVVRPSHLQGVSVVRGIMGCEYLRPFVAVKIAMLDPTTRKVVDIVVELIFKRAVHFSDTNYVTSLTCRSESGKEYLSNLYQSGGMTSSQITALRDLLEGKTIEAPIVNYGGVRYLIRKESE